MRVPLWIVLVTASHLACSEAFQWFDAVDGRFDDPNRWYVPEDGRLYPFQLRNPNPQNRKPGAGDRVSFTRHGVDDLPDRTGVAYEVLVPDGTGVSTLSAGPDARVGTLQRLTFTVPGRLEVGTLDLRGSIALRGGGTIEASTLTWGDVTLGGQTTVTAANVPEMSGVTISESSLLSVGILNNTLSGLRVSDRSSVEADSVVLRGGTLSLPSPDIAGDSTFRADRFEFFDGWMRLRSGSKLHLGTLVRRDPQTPSIAIVVADPGTEWVHPHPIEGPSVIVTNRGVVNLGPEVTNPNVAVWSAGSTLEVVRASGGGDLRAHEGGHLSATEVSLIGRVAAAGRGARVQISKSLDLDGDFRAESEGPDGGSTNEAAFARLSGTVNVHGKGSVAAFDTLHLGDRPGITTVLLQEGGTNRIRPNGTNWIGSAAGGDARVAIATSAVLDASTAREVIVGKSGIGSISVSDGRLVFGLPDNAGPPGLGTPNATCETADGPQVPEWPKFAIGSEAGSRGALSLTSPAAHAEIHGERFFVGDYGGEGLVWIRNGAHIQLSPPLMTLGRNRGAKGTLRLDGENSRLEGIQTGHGVKGTKLEIGRFGEGIAEILNGAELNLPSIILGCFEHSTGSVHVIGQSPGGTPSSFSADGSITIGSHGRGILAISRGGHARSHRDVVIGRFGSGEGVVTLQGADSRWSHTTGPDEATAGSVFVGMGGKGMLLVGDGAEFETGELIVGDRPDEPLVAEGTLIVTNGASVRAGGSFVTLGKESGSKGTLVLDGADSQLLGVKDRNDGVGATLEIGLNGAGTLMLTNGARLALPSVRLGSLPGSLGIVRVGRNSVFQSDDSITVGVVSTGRVEITTAGRIFSAKDAVIGLEEGAQGSVRLTGQNALWQHDRGLDLDPRGDLVVGHTGRGELEIAAGARVQAPQLVVGKKDKGFGEVTVRGSGSRMTLHHIEIGRDVDAANPLAPSGSGTVTITDQGLVELRPDGIARPVQIVSPLGRASVLSVALGGQFLAQESSLELGGSEQAQLSIARGGLAEVGSAIVGARTSDIEALAQVIGSPGQSARWNLVARSGTDLLTVGASGPGRLQLGPYAELKLANDGGIRIAGLQPGSVDIEGPDALLSLFRGRIAVGVASPGMLTIKNGAEVKGAAVSLEGPSGTRLDVLNANSLLEAVGSLVIRNASVLRADQGGRVQITADQTAGELLVTGPGSRLEAAQGTVEAGYFLEHLPGSIQVSGLSPGAPLTPRLTAENRGLVTATRLGLVNFAQVRVNGGSIDIGNPSGAPIANRIRIGPNGVIAGWGFLVGPAFQQVQPDVENGGLFTLLPQSLQNPSTPSSAVDSPTATRTPASGRTAAATVSLASNKRADPPEVPSATFTIDGSYEQRPDGTLAVPVFGPRPFLDYGVLRVTGSVRMAGRLSIDFRNGFAPRRGDAFAFLTSNATTAGTFDRVEIAGLAPGFQYVIEPNDRGGLSLLALNDGVPTSAPNLSMTRAGNQIILSWPIWAEGFGLQSTTDLALPNWRPRPTASSILILPMSEPREFFRLEQPARHPFRIE